MKTSVRGDNLNTVDCNIYCVWVNCNRLAYSLHIFCDILG